MKTKFKFLMAAAALTVGFSSCSNDDDNVPGGSGKEASVKITIPAPTTYADPNATTDETKFNSADILVYNGGSLEKHVSLELKDFTATSTGWEMKTPIIIQSGVKNIYVGLNLTDNDVAAVKKGLYSPYTLGANYAAIKSVIEANNTKGSAMFSVNDAANNSFNIVTGTNPNEISIKVERWAAKVTTRVSSTINTEIPSAEINSFSFAMGNVNTQIYPFQKLLASGVIEDPNWDWTAKTDAQFEADAKTTFVNEFGTNDNIDASAYTDVDAENVAVTARKVKYVTENTTKNPKQGDVTYVSVRAKFIPKAYHTFDGTNVTVVTTPPSQVPADLYVVETTSGEVYYFQVESEANSFKATLANATVGHYKNGLCYYFIWLDPNKTTAASPANTYAAIRNFFYDTKITKVNSLGYPNPEEPNPIDPLPKDTQLEVSIDIKDWVPVTIDSELGKI